MNFAHAITIAAILTSILTSGGSCHKSCRSNASLMKSIQYQLKLVEDNDGKCDCNQSPSTPSSGKVGFQVSNSGSLQNIGNGAIVIYETVTTNLGKGYDKSTGVFTARVHGLYYFTWTVLTYAGKSFYTQLLLNDTIIARNHAGAGGMSTHMPSSQSAVLQMSKNDKVSIRIYNAGTYMIGDKWSTFSGFKI
ncbi:complement C1q tumor necrosis factor-related protein 3-like [Mytilus galloprovincialis]|uniref:complement C1q tumor necrosis factor-related protein 3-like n=1 Tax=Mytilus galloprovincialis TaxID=29158 RepID=UPI003F7BC502